MGGIAGVRAAVDEGLESMFMKTASATTVAG